MLFRSPFSSQPHGNNAQNNSPFGNIFPPPGGPDDNSDPNSGNPGGRPSGDPSGDPGGGPPGGPPNMLSNIDRKKTKASLFTLPSLPSPAGFYFWRPLVRDAVAAAYDSDPDKAYEWILEVETSSATMESMGQCDPMFASLDAKLAEAINGITMNKANDLTKQLNIRKESLAKSKIGRAHV